MQTIKREQTRKHILIAALAAAAVLLLAASLGNDLWALRSAGLNGTPPPNASVVETLMGTLTDNAKWLIITGLTLVLTCVFGAMIGGSRKAPEVLYRIIGGIGGILIVVPAILS